MNNQISQIEDPAVREVIIALMNRISELEDACTYYGHFYIRPRKGPL